MEQDHYYVLTHSGERIGSTVKEARTTINVGGRALKSLFEKGAVKRININSKKADSNVKKKTV